MNAKTLSHKVMFCILMSIYVTLILLDGLLTYINTPDLALEQNPLVKHLGLGWGALFISNTIFLALITSMLYYAMFKYKTPFASANSVLEYASQLFYNRPDKKIWLLYRFPQNWKPFWAMTGYALLFAGIISRFILVVEWAFTLPAPYWNFRRSLPLNRVDVFAGLLVVLFTYFYWIINEYKKSKKQKGGHFENI